MDSPGILKIAEIASKFGSVAIVAPHVYHSSHGPCHNSHETPVLPKNQGG